MAQKRLLGRGPFLMGLTMAVIGAGLFVAPFLAPASWPDEARARAFEMGGMIGGALIGVGAIAMVVGVLGRNRGG
ncbi:MAG: hypothetical protein ACRC6I_08125 [Paracoccaceae bacterium]